MTSEIKAKLNETKDAVGELQSAFNDLVFNDRHDRRIYNFNHFQTTLTDFLTERIDGVFDAMSEAVDEIQRLEDELKEAYEKMEGMNFRLEMMKEKVEEGT